MSNLITDIEALKRTVKINAAIPWESIEPYIDDARDIYLVPHIGQRLIERAEQANAEDAELTARIARCLGPLALSLATDELGVQYGDSGITVDNQQGKRSPANDSKIAAAKQNLYYRGMQALDRLLDYLENHAEDYPEYGDHLRQSAGISCLIRSAQEYQNIGLVNIDYSTVTYRAMLPVLVQLQETTIRDILGATLYGRLTATEAEAELTELRYLCIRYIANRSAELYTTQTSRTQRGSTGTSGTQPEYKPVIRPLYDDMDETGNFFGRQANYYLSRIGQYLTENAETLGIEAAATAMEYNSKERKLFAGVI